ncbi:malate dehydrogenase, mitochondrial-like isoform X1 [Leptidea sinapis]|uniref:malate dehydrogenase, mitochondrial-like isoform X1 n=1 Tax=Leptidea sinapis TaxID=189913 RepID=UPI00213BAF2F|nr:malate dehydrogenase, mitochondrial-like isoform X1 [Leptidea sinapis]
MVKQLARILLHSGIVTPSCLSQGMRRGFARRPSDCRRAHVDIPPKLDPTCPVGCERKQRKDVGILHKIKLRILEGGSNFGRPFRLTGKNVKEVEVALTEQKALPAPKELAKVEPPRPGLQVSILGADSSMGQYVALLLKQCACIKKLRLYAASDVTCGRNIYQVAEDLKHINTNCLVQGYSRMCNELERCLQNTDIVLMMETGSVDVTKTVAERFKCNAPVVKQYADVISRECPKAFLVICASPIDCMVPLVAETLKESGWYNPSRLLGSLAVQEMRASTLAAKVLGLEPGFVRVPCVGGTEGETLVPLFSKAVDMFDFNTQHALMMTQTIRDTAEALSKSSGRCQEAANSSEAHALAGLVTKIAWALLCKDVPRVTGFVETDARQIISPASYLALEVLLNHDGICEIFDFPNRLSDSELGFLDVALGCLTENVKLAKNWNDNYITESFVAGKLAERKEFLGSKTYNHVGDCVHMST